MRSGQGPTFLLDLDFSLLVKTICRVLMFPPAPSSSVLSFNFLQWPPIKEFYLFGSRRCAKQAASVPRWLAVLDYKWSGNYACPYLFGRRPNFVYEVTGHILLLSLSFSSMAKYSNSERNLLPLQRLSILHQPVSFILSSLAQPKLPPSKLRDLMLDLQLGMPNHIINNSTLTKNTSSERSTHQLSKEQHMRAIYFPRRLFKNLAEHTPSRTCRNSARSTKQPDYHST